MSKLSRRLNKGMCVLLLDVFKHLLLRKLTFSKLVRKLYFVEKKFEEMH